MPGRGEASGEVLKALCLPIHDLGMFCEVEVHPGGQIVLHDRVKARSGQIGVKNIKLSITHRAGQTGAVVILEDGINQGHDRTSL
jgi:phosphopantetheinyl transferase (holo-ACP synthase)